MRGNINTPFIEYVLLPHEQQLFDTRTRCLLVDEASWSRRIKILHCTHRYHVFTLKHIAQSLPTIMTHHDLQCPNMVHNGGNHLENGRLGQNKIIIRFQSWDQRQVIRWNSEHTLLFLYRLQVTVTWCVPSPMKRHRRHQCTFIFEITRTG